MNVFLAAVNALRPIPLRVEIGREPAEQAVDMRQVGPVLVELTLQLINHASEVAACRRLRLSNRLALFEPHGDYGPLSPRPVPPRKPPTRARQQGHQSLG